VRDLCFVSVSTVCKKDGCAERPLAGRQAKHYGRGGVRRVICLKLC